MPKIQDGRQEKLNAMLKNNFCVIWACMVSNTTFRDDFGSVNAFLDLFIFSKNM